MNLFEKSILAIAPGWASSRAENRNKVSAYEAALPSRTHKANKERRSANQAVFASGKSLREQARWLDENHDISIGILDKFEERVIGPAGIMIEPQPRKISGEIDIELAEKISEKFKNWSLKPEVTGRFTRSQMERLVLRSWLRDGEVFAQQLKGKVAGYQYLTPTQYAIELLEADFVPIVSDLSKRINQGIQLNNWGRAIGYHILYDHPAEAFSTKSKIVPADKMLHLALIKRIHQIRGVTIFHGIITRLSDLKEYEESERVAARIAAALGMYIKKGSPDLYDVENTKETSRHFDLAPGSTFDELLPGEEVGMVESNRPSAQVVPWRSGQIKAAVAGVRGSYSSVARDYGGSYSSQRQELVESTIGYEVIQDEFVAQWSRPVFRSWLEMELLNDLKLPPDLDRDTLFDALYLAPTMPWIDPKKEADAWETLKSNGVASDAEWIRSRGKSPREVKRQVTAEQSENSTPVNKKNKKETSNEEE
ncbi:phage portal protein [Psychromonas sp. 14N.309.X.WAT.B.A12]|uniref:phage portal protein n=1 Tax=Psychromonas sp. 14N.309.X.WAT.B.A12 TaxID=2998322 RepID=UPI0025B00CAF|nr:phage portal protein [Psychromonas sp. 14N.309.X.WAT.B.A12]MDN2661844.1 phage portal protein [Psychromonas sp. 14N.309.X.WAT.B.A12]